MGQSCHWGGGGGGGSAYPQGLKLGHSLILLSRLPKQAPHSVPGPRQLLPQPDDLAQAGFHKIRHAQQPQRVSCGGGVKDDTSETGVVLTPDKLNYLQPEGKA